MQAARRCVVSSGSSVRQVAARRPQLRLYSAAPAASQTSAAGDAVAINGRQYARDEWFNVPPNVLAAVSRRLHLQRDHPVSITRQIIESQFPAPTYRHHNALDPVVTTAQNFDSLGFAADHPGRARSDTYYVNASTLLRTHTSAHQAETFAADDAGPGYLISADVYRRDAVDRTHYPVFHQTEGARTWDRAAAPGGDIVADIYADLAGLPTHDVAVEDPNPPMHPERNPLQAEFHTAAEAEAIGKHLKRSLELMVVRIFSLAQQAARRADPGFKEEPLRVRWVEAFFPFTSPSWELEVFYGGDWLEVLGCGVVRQGLLNRAGVPTRSGWAFGVGLERIAMILFQIPDIRLFWSRDDRFLGQFTGVQDALDTLRPFAPFSKYPACFKDVSFWLGSTSSAAGGGTKANAHDFHENDVMEVVRGIGGDLVEDVSLVDEFTHPKTGRRSLCYRVNYRSLERTLTNAEANDLHDKVTSTLVERLGVEIR